MYVYSVCHLGLKVKILLTCTSWNASFSARPKAPRKDSSPWSYISEEKHLIVYWKIRINDVWSERAFENFVQLLYQFLYILSRIYPWIWGPCEDSICPNLVSQSSKDGRPWKDLDCWCTNQSRACVTLACPTDLQRNTWTKRARAYKHSLKRGEQTQQGRKNSGKLVAVCWKISKWAVFRSIVPMGFPRQDNPAI